MSSCCSGHIGGYLQSRLAKESETWSSWAQFGFGKRVVVWLPSFFFSLIIYFEYWVFILRVIKLARPQEVTGESFRMTQQGLVRRLDTFNFLPLYFEALLLNIQGHFQVLSLVDFWVILLEMEMNMETARPELEWRSKRTRTQVRLHTNHGFVLVCKISLSSGHRKW